MRNARGHELEDSLFGILVFLCTLIRRFEETSACIRTHDSQFSRQAPTLPNVQYYIHEVFFLSSSKVALTKHPKYITKSQYWLDHTHSSSCYYYQPR